MDKYGINADTGQWRNARAEAVEGTADATRYSQTYGSLILATLAAGGGKHSAFRSPASSTSLTQQLGNGEQLPTVKSAGGASTVTVPTHAGSDRAKAQNYADTGVEALAHAAAETTCGWIVDLRQDSGGDMYPMIAALSPLLAQGRLMSFIDRNHHTTWVTLSGATVNYQGNAPSDRVSLTVNTQRPSLPSRPVAVLQGQQTASSGEATLLALKGQKNAHTFGQITAGFASGNVVKTMPDGATITLTTSWDSDKTGKKTYPNGIRPETKTTPGASTAAAAVTWLKKQCKT